MQATSPSILIRLPEFYVGTLAVGSGVQVPLRKRAPADLKKDASGFDLPIALGLLLGSAQVSFDRPGSFAIVGELALTGETRPIKGVLVMALQAAAEKRAGILVPSANAQEAAVVEGLSVYPVGSRAEAVGFLSGQVETDPESVDLEEVFQQLSQMKGCQLSVVSCQLSG
jgi:magnesium chelatase family protein